MQRISLQPEDVSSEAEPIMIELRGDLCDSVEAGTSISVVGTMRLEPMTKNGLICSHYILASSIKERTEVAGRINLTKEDLEEVATFEDSVDLEEKMQLLIDSWAGHIHGHDDIKKAMVLAVVGAVPNLKFGLRPNFHILLIGDPGTAKSKLLDLATKLASRKQILRCQFSHRSRFDWGVCATRGSVHQQEEMGRTTRRDTTNTRRVRVCDRRIQSIQRRLR